VCSMPSIRVIERSVGPVMRSAISLASIALVLQSMATTGMSISERYRRHVAQNEGHGEQDKQRRHDKRVGRRRQY